MPLFFVLTAQFFSALADNAFLFAAIAALRAHAYPEWSFPVLQESFVLAYIALAPFVGPIADAIPKGRVMMWSNLVKLIAVGMLLCSANPFIAYGLAGVGAAFYSPAKYGILGELLPVGKLVKANGMMEATTIVAIVVGAVAGGLLADQGAAVALWSIGAVYVVAAALNLGIPKLVAQNSLASFNPTKAATVFFRDLKPLWRDPSARLAILGTSAFWSSGVALRFLLVAWVPFALGITTNRAPAYLNALTAIGIVVGAGFAAWKIPLGKAHKTLPFGIGMGFAVIALSMTHSLAEAVPLLITIGALGGAFVVPLNALMQSRGHAISGTGHAVAAQNLFENGAMLLALGVETVIGRSGVNPAHQALMYGSLIIVLLGTLAFTSGKAIAPTAEAAH